MLGQKVRELRGPEEGRAEGYYLREFAGVELELKTLPEASRTFAVQQALVPCQLSLLCPAPGGQRASSHFSQHCTLDLQHTWFSFLKSLQKISYMCF